MPAVSRLPVVPAGQTLEEAILEDFALGILDPPDEFNIKPEPNPYSDYAGKPIQFCRDVLNVQFTEDVEDMLTEAQNTPSTLAKSANGVGKTFAAACFVVYWFLVYDDAQVYTLAAPPEDNLKLLLWGEIGAIVEKHPHLFLGFQVSLASLSIRRNRKSFVVGLAIPQSADTAQLKSRFSGKHAPKLLFVVDEGDGVPAAIYEAIESCMSGGMARMLVLFNPRAEAGPVFQMEQKREGVVVNLTAFNHPNVLTGKDLIPGAVTRETVVRRIHLWTVPLNPGEKPESDCFEVPAFLVGYVARDRANNPLPPLKAGWRKVVEPSFSYMVLGQYPAAGENQLISGAWVDAAFARFELWVARYGMRPPAVRPALSYDVAELGQDQNCVTLWYANWVPPQILWGGVDVLKGGDTAADIYFNNVCDWASVDATGVGAGAWAQMKRRGCIAHRIMVGSTKALKEKNKEQELEEDPDLEGFDRIRSQMLWDLAMWLRNDQGAMIAPCKELREELVAPTYSKNVKQQICICSTDVMKEKLGRSPDRLMSMGLRFARRPKETAGEVTQESYVNTTSRNGSHRGK
jgi:hypothetical protein